MEQRVADLEGTLVTLAKRMEEMAANQAAEAKHREAGGRQHNMILLEKLAKLEGGMTTTAPAPPDPVPAWMKVTGAVAAIAIPVTVIAGMLISYGRNDARAESKIAEVQNEARQRIAALETAVNTAGRIRDQQMEALRDGQRQLQQADMAGNERLGTVLTELATIRALGQAQAQRTEELIRRQDRLENRLGARPGAMEPPEQPTVYPAPL